MWMYAKMPSSYSIAWRMLKLIRKAMSKDELAEFLGIVEMDETYIGNKQKHHRYDRLF
jgi:hypothetical protein